MGTQFDTTIVWSSPNCEEKLEGSRSQLRMWPSLRPLDHVFERIMHCIVLLDSPDNAAAYVQ